MPPLYLLKNTQRRNGPGRHHSRLPGCQLFLHFFFWQVGNHPEKWPNNNGFCWMDLTAENGHSLYSHGRVLPSFTQADFPFPSERHQRLIALNIGTRTAERSVANRLLTNAPIELPLRPLASQCDQLGPPRPANPWARPGSARPGPARLAGELSTHPAPAVRQVPGGRLAGPRSSLG